jgi:hypothetical protein
MIIVPHGDKTKRLVDFMVRPLRGLEHLRQALDQTRLHLETDLHEISRTERVSELQQTAGHRNRRQFAFGPLSILFQDDGRDRSPEQDAGRAPLRMRMGEGHARDHCRTSARPLRDYGSTRLKWDRDRAKSLVFMGVRKRLTNSSMSYETSPRR